MCMRDLLTALYDEGLPVRETQVRWAIASGKITRPPLDGSLRFDFGREHLEQLRQLFAAKSKESERC